jgi:hypothetical protein
MPAKSKQILEQLLLDETNALEDWKRAARLWHSLTATGFRTTDTRNDDTTILQAQGMARARMRAWAQADNALASYVARHPDLPAQGVTLPTLVDDVSSPRKLTRRG